MAVLSNVDSVSRLHEDPRSEEDRRLWNVILKLCQVLRVFVRYYRLFWVLWMVTPPHPTMFNAASEPATVNPSASTSSEGVNMSKSFGGSRKADRTLVSATSVEHWELEYSVHAVPPTVKSDVAAAFPDLESQYPGTVSSVLITPVFIRTTVQLAALGEAVESEKNRGLNVFHAWAGAVREALGRLTFAAGLPGGTCWMDGGDPVTGYPLWGSHGGSIWADLEAVESVLPTNIYSTAAHGGCKVLSHPRWGAAVYPTTLLTNAPAELWLAALSEAAATAMPSPLPQIMVGGIGGSDDDDDEQVPSISQG